MLVRLEESKTVKQASYVIVISCDENDKYPVLRLTHEKVDSLRRAVKNTFDMHANEHTFFCALPTKVIARRFAARPNELDALSFTDVHEKPIDVARMRRIIKGFSS